MVEKEHFFYLSRLNDAMMYPCHYQNDKTSLISKCTSVAKMVCHDNKATEDPSQSFRRPTSIDDC